LYRRLHGGIPRSCFHFSNLSEIWRSAPMIDAGSATFNLEASPSSTDFSLWGSASPTRPVPLRQIIHRTKPAPPESSFRSQGKAGTLQQDATSKLVITKYGLHYGVHTGQAEFGRTDKSHCPRVRFQGAARSAKRCGVEGSNSAPLCRNYAGELMLRRCWKHSRQNTGRPCVGRKGTVVSFPHCEQVVLVSAR
jgi:hypothetical protein